MRTRLIVMAAAAVVSGLAAGPAAAQVGPGPAGSRIDLSTNVIWFQGETPNGDHVGEPAGGGLFTIHFTPRHGMQFTSDYADWRGQNSSNKMVVFAAEYRHTFRLPSRRLRLFATVGLLGFAQREAHDGFVSPFVNASGIPLVVRPAHTETTVIPPIVPKASFGVEYFFTDRLGIRGETGVVGVFGTGGFRTGVGLVVAAGRPRTLSSRAR